jgi:hypothetical protein
MCFLCVFTFFLVNIRFHCVFCIFNIRKEDDGDFVDDYEKPELEKYDKISPTPITKQTDKKEPEVHIQQHITTHNTLQTNSKT